MNEPTLPSPLMVSPNPTAVLVLADGSTFPGQGLGAVGDAVGEVCFNTSMTGYQEILTDPSYAGQIITFTFPHIGNVGANVEDIESVKPAAQGLLLRADITTPSNFRSGSHLNHWLKAHALVGIAGIDTRALTIRIRKVGAPSGVIAHDPKGDFDIPAMRERAAQWGGLEGMDLAKEVTCAETYDWSETCWGLRNGYGELRSAKHHVVAVDYGAKRNILRCLASAGCRVTVVPAHATAEEILGHNPNGVFLSNGPGDPAATGAYAVPVLRSLLNTGLPIFGICLGHQMLALSLGAQTEKMHHGHRGANHPVKDISTGKVEITSQNHGFVVVGDSLPQGVKASHISLFDQTLEGIVVEGRPIFAVQYHPEASPGPQDSHYLFKRFTALMDGS
ncbi:MAG: Carbamoyl-phosphate synthase small chain [Alphaproteobacteria bacterium MarineAlpha9_Bin7]|nr:MAG: Carbamoyl-phosphate synthase small chain [Alphaproteobacteria bacterium MarineAlpha9_Bin7]